VTLQTCNLPIIDIPSDSIKAIKAYRKSGGGEVYLHSLASSLHRSGQNQALAALTPNNEPLIMNSRLGGTQNWSRYFGE